MKVYKDSFNARKYKPFLGGLSAVEAKAVSRISAKDDGPGRSQVELVCWPSYPLSDIVTHITIIIITLITKLVKCNKETLSRSAPTRCQLSLAF